MARTKKPGKPGVVGQNLRRLMAERGVSDTVLERASDVPRSTINFILREPSEPRADTIRKLAKGLAVPETELTRAAAGELDVEVAIAQFKASPWAATLEPPLNDDDVAWLRQGIFWVGKKPTPKALQFLVLAHRESK